MARLHVAVTVADRTVSVTVEATHTPGDGAEPASVTGRLGVDTELADETAPPPDDAVPFGFITGQGVDVP